MEVWTWVSFKHEDETINDFLVKDDPRQFIIDNSNVFGEGKILGSFNDYETAEKVFRALAIVYPLHTRLFNLPGINFKE
jgi:hypothetical protein